MTFEFQEARELMVENQLRPNKINDQRILDLFRNIKKEDFINDELKTLSYSDLDILISKKRGYLKNLQIAQLISSCDISYEDKILHVGGMTGYISVILSKLCKQLIVLENDEKLLLSLNKNIRNLDIQNIKIINNNLEKGNIEYSPYDIIIIDNPVYEIPISFKDQLSKNFGKIVYIKKINTSLSKTYRMIRNNRNFSIEYLFDVFTNYELFKKNESFVF